MSATAEAPEVSLCVSPAGDAAVFVTRATDRAAPPLHPGRLAAALAARGLRLVGVSSSAKPAPGACVSTRSKIVASGSLLDAVLSLVGEPRLVPAVA